MPDETNDVNNAVSCYKKPVLQYSSVVPSLCRWPVFDEIFGTAINFYFVLDTLIKTANTPLDRSSVIVLSVINYMDCSYTGIYQIQLEICRSRTCPDF